VQQNVISRFLKRGDVDAVQEEEEARQEISMGKKKKKRK
jgi:hypothetical protein